MQPSGWCYQLQLSRDSSWSQGLVHNQSGWWKKKILLEIFFKLIQIINLELTIHVMFSQVTEYVIHKN